MMQEPSISRDAWTVLRLLYGGELTGATIFVYRNVVKSISFNAVFRQEEHEKSLQDNSHGNRAFFTTNSVLADDPEHDLAIVKVEGKNLPALSLADLAHVAVGDHVLAIGSPLGLENSVSD